MTLARSLLVAAAVAGIAPPAVGGMPYHNDAHRFELTVPGAGG
jgi:hypothetical protein